MSTSDQVLFPLSKAAGTVMLAVTLAMGSIATRMLTKPKQRIPVMSGCRA